MHAAFILLLVSSGVMAVEEPDNHTWPQPGRPTPAPVAHIWHTSLDSNDLLLAPKPLSFGLDIMTDSNGNQRITPYQQLNLTAEKSVSLSFEHHTPRIRFKAGGINTAIKLRGNGVKLQFKPTDQTIPLQVELKLTDDGSSVRFDYRF